MLAKDELERLVGTLSEYECRLLLPAIRDASAGERFWEGDIGLLYHEYTKVRYLNARRELPPVGSTNQTADAGVFAPIPLVKSYVGVEQIALPQAEDLDASITDTMLHRRSRRDYTGAAISLPQLSTLLQHGCGMTGSVAAYSYTRLPLRSFPSSGGLQAVEIYISIQAVEGLSSGLYHYRPIDHALEAVKPGTHGATLRLLTFDQPYVEASAAVILITGNYARLRWKYGERSYRYMCMDTGFVGENLYLAAEALGVGACVHSGFAEDAIEEFLGIDGKEEIAMLLVTIGVPRRSEDEA